MQKRSCLVTIRQEYDLLTPGEKKIADYILASAEAVISMSVAEFAENVGVVQSSVSKCCRRLGFSGYSDMKLSLAMELSKNRQLNFVPYIDPNDSASGIFEKVFSANDKTLRDTAEALDREVFEQLVDAMDKANTVYIYGIGTSAMIAELFQFRLMKIGKSTFCVTDVPIMKISTLNIQKGDVAIGISNSGRTVAVLEALKLAKEHGAFTACLTSYPDSLITEICDYPLVIATDEIQYPIEAVSACIAHISVLDSIAISLSARHYDDAVMRAEKAREFADISRRKK